MGNSQGDIAKYMIGKKYESVNQIGPVSTIDGDEQENILP